MNFAYAGKSLRQVTNYKPLRKCDIEELAAIQETNPSGGVLFARNPERKQKDIARKMILDLFTKDAREKPLKILTMPGLDWRFERKLLGKREGDWMRKSAPARTAITAIENDRYIYYAATHKMPGVTTPKALVKIGSPEPFAEQRVSTKFVRDFHFANIDDLMESCEYKWHVAWLDYTGPLTIDRLRLISRFFEKNIKETLIVTAMKARYRKDVSVAIDRCGGYFHWLRQHLSGEVLHEHEYFDTCPMAQFAITHSEALTNALGARS